MQLLYSMSRDKALTQEALLERYRQSVEASFQLYLYNLLYWVKVAEFARTDAKMKKAKLLPTEADKRFQPKLFENALIFSVTENAPLNDLFQRHQLQEKIQEDSCRILYTEFAKSETYQEYLQQEVTQVEDHRRVLLELYKFMAGHELFNETMEDHFLSWVDEKSLVVGAMKKTIKALPATGPFYEDYRPNPETTREFGEELLKRVCQRDEELLGLIEPTLNNWDVDRVAVIDMILLKMALCELMEFPTIPTKVTLNEFVEISKLYSTDKSKDFINGILDRLMKKLHKEGKIRKEGRGLLE